MKTAEIIKKMRVSGYMILMLAVVFSLAWHIFWLSIIKVVAAPTEPSQVKFSKVSFLGQILATVGLHIRPRPASRTLLEKRYLDVFYRYEHATSGMDKVRDEKYSVKTGPGGRGDGNMLYLIGEVVSEVKAEPD